MAEHFREFQRERKELTAEIGDDVSFCRRCSLAGSALSALSEGVLPVFGLAYLWQGLPASSTALLVRLDGDFDWETLDWRCMTRAVRLAESGIEFYLPQAAASTLVCLWTALAPRIDQNHSGFP